MTREEAIEEINKAFEPAFANYIIIALTEGVTVSDKAISTLNNQDGIHAIGYREGYKQAQADYKDVLDKIRAEIAEIPKKYPMTMDYENGLKEALTIIDKYKSESKDK